MGWDIKFVHMWILHDWSDERCVEILRNCKEAIQNKKIDGKVIIIDMVVDKQKKDNHVETMLFFDMLMMVVTPGRERTEKDWANLF
ncbi:hypothetical protein Leryth_011634 [Lithospermum erythrorhizon]|nr:hypothetical protein Leryth_011634 [Lithospermum erythrorhizon]